MTAGYSFKYRSVVLGTNNASVYNNIIVFINLKKSTAVFQWQNGFIMERGIPQHVLLLDSQGNFSGASRMFYAFLSGVLLFSILMNVLVMLAAEIFL